jgi:hypothetical protein
LGEIPFESSRIIIIFLGNLSRFSLLNTPDRPCPYCNETLYSSHFFRCTRFPWELRHVLTWSNLVDLFVNRDWRQATTYLFQVFRQWERVTRIFRPNLREHLDSYFDHLRSMSNNTVVTVPFSVGVQAQAQRNLNTNQVPTVGSHVLVHGTRFS